MSLTRPPLFKTHLPTRAIAVVAAAAGLAVTLAGCGSTAAPGSQTPAGSNSQQHNAADVTFSQSMIPHHQQAVEMAKMGATQAANPAVRQLAAQIQAAQDPEIKNMTGWLSAWRQPTAMPGGDTGGHSMSSMPGMMSTADMTKLGTLSGSTFDREFLSMMTAHHTGAIEMARTELAQGRYGPAKALASSIIADQTAEISKMKTLQTPA